MDCTFCKIVKKEIPAEIVYEDDATIAFLDIHPRAPGHVMVIPKAHAANLLELAAPLVGPLFVAVKKVTAAIAASFCPEGFAPLEAEPLTGFTIGINHGRISGQAVDHLHVHIMPRFAEDGGGSVHSVVDNPPTEKLAAIAEKIRKEIN